MCVCLAGAVSSVVFLCNKNNGSRLNSHSQDESSNTMSTLHLALQASKHPVLGCHLYTHKSYNVPTHTPTHVYTSTHTHTPSLLPAVRLVCLLTLSLTSLGTTGLLTTGLLSTFATFFTTSPLCTASLSASSTVCI